MYTYTTPPFGTDLYQATGKTYTYNLHEAAAEVTPALASNLMSSRESFTYGRGPPSSVEHGGSADEDIYIHI